MRISRLLNHRVLAIHPSSRTFGYVVLESPRKLADWGVRATRGNKARQTLAFVSKLLSQYRPDVVVLENCDALGSRRRRRVRNLTVNLKVLARRHHVAVCAISKQRVRVVFAGLGAPNREETTRVLADKLPELAHWLPKHRKIYMPDHYRMATFDAAALALTYYYTRRAK